MSNAVLLSFIALASVSDLRYRKVKNYIVFPCFLTGLVLSFAHGGAAGLADSILAALYVFTALFPFFSARLIGAGDIKFTMAIALFLGQDGMYDSLIPIAVASTVTMLTMAAYHRSFKNLKIPMIIPISLGVIYMLVEKSFGGFYG